MAWIQALKIFENQEVWNLTINKRQVVIKSSQNNKTNVMKVHPSIHCYLNFVSMNLRKNSELFPIIEKTLLNKFKKVRLNF